MNPGPDAIAAPDRAPLRQTLRPAGPALLFGLRLWASVCLALYIAFWLQLENPSWAGTTAAIVCQPQLGASLRKASFRLIGTVVGAVAIVILTAAFPQDRVGFLLGLALWGAASCFVATILRNFATYGAALAGYTAAIIAMGELGATGGPGGDVVTLAIIRASETIIGIVSAGVVLAGTDLGHARRGLTTQFAALSAEVAGRFSRAFLPGASGYFETLPIRRELLRRAIALDPAIDTAIGEASDLRYRSWLLQAALSGLVAAILAWRKAALCIDRLPSEEARQGAALIEQKIPPELRDALAPGAAARWIANPASVRLTCIGAARTLIAVPGDAPSRRLLADSAAEALLGLSRALNGLAVLADPARAVRGPRRIARLHVPDWLPAIVNAARVFATISAVALFWIATAWPNGAAAITFAAIISILLSPQADQAPRSARAFFAGVLLACALATIAVFAVLPQITTFPGLCLVLGVVLVPLSSMIAAPWQPVFFLAASVNFIPLLGPSNEMTYDGQQFFNSALAILAGIGAAVLGMELLPPLSQQTRSRRLLNLTLRDLRHLAQGRGPHTQAQWEGRAYSRLLALPDQALPQQRAELAAALTVGTAIIRLRTVAPRLNIGGGLALALEAVAQGQSRTAAERLARLDAGLVAQFGAQAGQPKARVVRRARADILAITQELGEFRAYFDREAPA